MVIENHIQKRVEELCEVVKLLDQGIREEAEIDMENSLIIRAKYKENPELKASEVQSQVIEIQKASRRYYLKTQQILQLIPVLSELKLLANLFKIEITVPKEDQDFFNNLTQKTQSIYGVEKGKLIMVSAEIEKSINEEFEKLSTEPKNIEAMFQSVLLRKDFKQ